MSFNFNDIANQKLEDVKKVPLGPVGTYRWVITKLPNVRDFKGNDGTEYQAVEFPCQVIQALDDVDVTEYPGDITDIRLTLSFMFNKNDEVAFIQFQNQLKRFFVETLQCVGEDASLKEGINASVKKQFLAPILHKDDKNGEPRANIGKAMPLD